MRNIDLRVESPAPWARVLSQPARLRCRARMAADTRHAEGLESHPEQSAGYRPAVIRNGEKPAQTRPRRPLLKRRYRWTAEALSRAGGKDNQSPVCLAPTLPAGLMAEYCFGELKTSRHNVACKYAQPPNWRKSGVGLAPRPSRLLWAKILKTSYHENRDG